MENKKIKFTFNLLFGIYLLILVWIILLKMEFSIENISHHHSINLIPYGLVTPNGIEFFTKRVLNFREVRLNIIIFLPFGVYLSLLKPNWSFIKKTLTFVAFSSVLEILQYILVIGITDITDVLNNTIGGILGIISLFIISKIFKNKTTTVVLVLNIIILGLFLSMFTLLYLANH